MPASASCGRDASAATARRGGRPAFRGWPRRSRRRGPRPPGSARPSRRPPIGAAAPRPDDDHVGMDEPDGEVGEAVGRDGIDHERRRRSRAVAEALPHGGGGQAHLRVPLRAGSSGHRRQRPDGRGAVGRGPAMTSASGVFSASVRTSCSSGGGADSAEGGSQPPSTSSSRSSPSSSSTTRGTRERSAASAGFEAEVMDGRRRSPGGARPRRSAAHRGPARSTRPSRRPGSA